MQQDRTANDEFCAQLKRLAVATWRMDDWNAWLEHCYNMLSEEERSLLYELPMLLCARLDNGNLCEFCNSLIVGGGCNSGHQLVPKRSPRSHQVVTKWSQSFHYVVTKWLTFGDPMRPLKLGTLPDVDLTRPFGQPSR